MFDLKGKLALVVGAAGYLGSDVCRGFAECGAEIIAADWNQQGLEVLAETLKAQGAAVRCECLDCADPAQTAGLMDSVKNTEGAIDVLVNAVYYRTSKGVDELAEEEFTKANKVNITAAFSLLQQASQLMGPGASVILFSSMYGSIAPNPGDYPEGTAVNPIEYGAGKAGVNQLVRYAAAWLGSRQIRVNAIAPGAFPWNVTDNEEFLRRLRAKSMLGRVGRQHEISGAAVFLASDEASFVTGQVLSVDGGVSAW